MTESVTLQRLKDGHRSIEWAGSTTSSVVDLQPGSVGTLVLDSSFAGTTLNVLVPGMTAGTWIELHQDGSIVEIPVTSDSANVMPVELFTATGQVKFKSDASETCTGQYRPVK